MNIGQLCMGCMTDKGNNTTCPKCGWQEGTQPEIPQHLPPRTMLNGRYLLGRVLGQGGFGVTYLSWDSTLNTRLAIKEYLPQNVATRYAGETKVIAYSAGGAQEQFRYGLDRFLEEARALARFADNPHVVAVRDYFEANGTGYLVMAYLDGITFKQFLAQNGNRISYEAALRVMIPVLEALEDVHAVGLLHRDISPDNIYITRNNQVKVLDFGAARYALGDRSKSLSIILKAGYAPEEQYRSKGVQGPWTDIYATAATLYRAITGLVPPEALDRAVEDAIVLPSKMGVSLPGGAEAALMKALAVYAQYRYQTVREFKDALLACSPGLAAGATAYSPEPPYKGGLEQTQAAPIQAGFAPTAPVGLEKSGQAAAPAGAYAPTAPVQGAYPPTVPPQGTYPSGAYPPGAYPQGPGTYNPPYQAGATAPGPGYGAVPPYQTPYGPGVPPKKKKWPWILGITALVLLLIVGGGIWLIGTIIAESNQTTEAPRPHHDVIESGTTTNNNGNNNNSASGVVVESITMCQSVDETKVVPVGPTTVFTSTSGQIYAYVKLNQPVTGQVTGNWYFIDPKAGRQFYTTYTVDGSGTNSVFYFWIKNQTFQAGNWEFEVVVENGPTQSTPFTVNP